MRKRKRIEAMILMAAMLTQSFPAYAESTAQEEDGYTKVVESDSEAWTNDEFEDLTTVNLPEEEEAEVPEASEAEKETAMSTADARSYLAAHLDADKDPEIVNYMHVMQTLFDGKLVEKDDTIDGIFAYPDQQGKLISSLDTYTALYDVSEESEYYYALVNTMLADADTYVQDYAFAKDDTSGTALEGCTYDKETGIAAIPKDIFITSDGEKDVYMYEYVQIQLMQVVDEYNSAEDSVYTVTKEGYLKDETLVQNSDIYDLGVDVDLSDEKVRSGDDLTVAVNDMPMDDEGIVYDEETGILHIPYSSAGINNIRISAEHKSVLNRIMSSAASFFGPKDVEAAITIKDMPYVNTEPILLPANIVSQQPFIIESVPCYYYNQNQRISQKGVYMMDPRNIRVSGVVNAVNTGIEASTRYAPVTGEVRTKFRMDFSNAKLRTAAGEVVDFSPIKQHVYLICSHATSQAGVERTVFNNWVPRKVKVRILKTNFAEGWALVGAMSSTSQATGQAGFGLFKIRIALAGADVNLHKVSANAAMSNTSSYSLAGAVYGLYNDSECTDKIGEFTTNSNGDSNTIRLMSGTYYVKEITAPRGFKKSDAVIPVTVATANQTVQVEDPPYKHGNVQLEKVSGVDSTALSGAEFTIYKWSNEASGYAAAGTMTETAPGIYKTGELYADEDNPDGKFKIKETQAPPHYTGSFEREFTLGETPDTLYYNAVPNYPKPVTVRLKKTDETDVTKKLSDGTFVIYEFNGTDFSTTYATMVWDDTQEAYLASVQASETNKGWFKVIEEVPPTNYTGTYEEQFQIKHPTAGYYVEEGGTLYFDLHATNEPKTESGYVNLIKTSARDNTKELTDGLFYVYEWDQAENRYITEDPVSVLTYDAASHSMKSKMLYRHDAPVSSGATGANGDAVRQNMGKFKIEEIKPPTGYVNTHFTAEVTITDSNDFENPQVLFNDTVTNEPNSVEIFKTNENDVPLDGVTYHIWSDEGYDVTRSTAGGKITLEELPEGNYHFQETATLDNYVLNDKVRDFSIDAQGLINGTETSYSYTDINYSLEEAVIRKVDLLTGGTQGAAVEPSTGLENTEIFPNGTTFKVLEYSTRLGGYKTSPCMNIAYSGTDFVNTATGARPVFERTADNGGQFRLIETSATDGYVLDDTPIDIIVPVLDPGDNRQKTITVNNQPNHVTIHKSGMGRPLAGAHFNIWNADNPGSVVDAVTDDNGEINLYRLRPGIWYYQETVAPEGFTPDGNLYSFEIGEDGRTPDGLTYAEFTVENKKSTTLTIIKKDAETGEEYYPGSDFPAGTEFNIYEWNKADNGYDDDPIVHVVYSGN